MKTNIFLIRSSKYDSSRLKVQISNFEKHNIEYCIIEEQYENSSLKTHFKSSKHIVVGPDYLESNTLAKFNRVGWQCGDYVAYIGYDFFPNYNFYWIVDSDLYLNLDLNDFICKTNKLDFDCLATNYGVSNSNNWIWHQSMLEEYNTVYKMLFCLVRLSNSAVSFLKEKRIRYCQNFKRNQYGTFFANDESFTATVLTNEGFTCQQLQKVIPEYFSNDLFSLCNLFHIDELDEIYAKDQIIHPLCDSATFKIKINSLLKNNQRELILNRTYRFFCRYNEEKYKDLSSVPLLDIYKTHYNSDSIVNLLDLSKKFQGLPNIKKQWFWKPTVYVIDFLFKDIEFGIDIVADGSVFIVPRNNKAKDVIKKIFGNDGSKICVIKQEHYLNKNLDVKLTKSFLENILNLITLLFWVIDVEF